MLNAFEFNPSEDNDSNTNKIKKCYCGMGLAFNKNEIDRVYYTDKPITDKNTRRE